MFLRAMQRGELPRGLDVLLMQAIFHGTVMFVILSKREVCDDAKLSYIAGVALHGALGRAVTVPRQSA